MYEKYLLIHHKSSQWQDVTCIALQTKMKVLFTSPHNGCNPLDIKRKNVPNGCDKGEFSLKNDLFTSPITESIATNIENISEKTPYTEVAIISRTYIDHNREEACAFEESESNHKAKEAYWDYHNGILSKIEAMLPAKENGIAFLFDIHGATQELIKGQPFDILIGTDEDRSIHALTKIDPDVWTSPNGLIRLLQGKDIVVYPPDPSQTKDPHHLDGGYTIKKYGSNGTRGLAAIQIEVSNSIREDRSRRQKFAADAADSIFNFVKPFV